MAPNPAIRVLCNALQVRQSSLGVVTENLLRGWKELGVDDELHIALRPDVTLDLPPSVTVHHLPGHRLTATEVRLPALCRSLEADALIGMTPASVIAPLPCPQVVIAHDLRYLQRPGEFTHRARLLRSISYDIGYRRSDVVICVSHKTRHDLMELRPGIFGGGAIGGTKSERRIVVAPNGADHVLNWPPRRPGAEYALAFGQWGNKNVDLVLEAWKILSGQDQALPLVVVGLVEHTRRSVQGRLRSLGLDDIVSLRPWLNPEEFQSLFTSAALIVFPSAYEGFGLPAVEAMRLGIPVVITPERALLEVTGGLATVMPSWKPHALARAVPLARRTTPRQLKEAVAHASRFTWRRAAATVRGALVNRLDAS